MASGKFNLYDIGQAGVNVVVNPLQLQKDAAVLLQNVVFPTASGEGGIGKRGGLTRLNASALNSGASVLAIGSVPLPNPFNAATLPRKYMYVADETEVWYRSSDGAVWTPVDTPGTPGFFSNPGKPVLGIPPVQPVVGLMLYVSGDGAHDDIWVWDNTSARLVLVCPSVDTTVPIEEAFCAGASGFHNGAYYFGTIAYTYGRLFRLDMVTGQLTMIIGAMGADYTAYSIFSFVGQLFVGVSDDNSGGATSYVYRCNPDSDTAWTVDSAALTGVPVSMVNFLGNLYIGTGSKVAAQSMNIYKRTPSGVYSTVFTDATPWNVTCGGQLAVFADKIFAYMAGTIYSSPDGAVWTSELDVFTTYTSFAGRCGRPVEFDGALYWPFEDTADTGTGRVLKRTSAGVWSSVLGPTTLEGILTVLELP